MWVSTGNAGSPNACAITTLAVLWPTPGRRSSASMSRGTFPPCSATSVSASFLTFFAFVGASPQARMHARISSTLSLAIRCGVDARSKSAGVTLFTCASVVCADRSTATRSVNGSRCSSGIGGAG